MVLRPKGSQNVKKNKKGRGSTDFPSRSEESFPIVSGQFFLRNLKNRFKSPPFSLGSLEAGSVLLGAGVSVFFCSVFTAAADGAFPLCLGLLSPAGRSNLRFSCRVSDPASFLASAPASFLGPCERLLLWGLGPPEPGLPPGPAPGRVG